jgi:hypothetical protein
VQYVSGGSLYVEGLSHNRWVARNWTFASHPVAHDWDLPAFEIGVKTDPAAMGVPPIELSEWRFVQAQELPDTARSARHAVVTLSSMRMPVTVKVHTVLDGTSVLIRWLEITNESNASIALMSVAPLAGQLWPPSSHIELGHPTREDCCEGWFGWNKLPLGMTRFHHEIGLSADHPYFILRNEQDREYFFAQLEWPLNRVMEFNNSGKGISFQMGPAAATALRIIGPHETIDTPKMHVGHTKGDFDNAVQDMLDHIRRSVLLPRKANLAYRIETLMPEDWPFTLYRGTQFNETNIKKFLNAASQLGVEVFILDGPMWCANYGEWLTPQKQEFPNGLSPIVDYAHNHHMLFGLYVEPEGGRDGYTSMEHGLTIGPWRNSEVYRQHPYWFKGNMVLDLGDPAAEAYMQSELEKIIRALDGNCYELPSHSLITSRFDASSPRGVHYALVCYSESALTCNTASGELRISELRNLLTGRPVGASQVTAVVTRNAGGSVSGAVYKMGFRARLIAPYFLRLRVPLPLTAYAADRSVGQPYFLAL